MIQAGKDYIGIGVGAMVFNEDGAVFLAKRGPQASNEKGCWEFPGGSLDFGETLVAGIEREFYEEYGAQIAVTELLGVFDHILNEGQEHWVSATYIARLTSGTPQILEPHKCTEIGWFPLDNLPAPLSRITADNLKTYLARV